MTNNWRAYAQEQADIQEQEAYLARNRVTPPGLHERPVYVEPPSIRWRRIARLLIEVRDDLREIQTRTDGLFEGYNADHREKCREVVAELGPHIADVMREVQRHEEQLDAAGARYRQWIERVQRDHRENTLMEGGS